MSAMVIFGGHVSGEMTNAQHALRINATYDFNSLRFNAMKSWITIAIKTDSN